MVRNKVLLGLAVVSLIPLTGVISRAQDPSSCSTIDLVSTGRFPPVRNQGEDGWCYAYTAADLLTYRYGGMFSPVDVAINALRFTALPQNITDDMKKQFNSNGYKYSAISDTPNNATTAILATSYYGACDDVENIHELNTESNEMGGLTAILIEIENSEMQLRYNPGLASENSAQFASAVTASQQLYPSIRPDEVKSLLASASQNPHPEMAFIDGLSSQSCRHFIKPQNLKLGADYGTDSKDPTTPAQQWRLMQEVDEYLAKGIPISMSYYYHLGNLKNSGAEFQQENPKMDNAHLSIIAGRRFNKSKNVCEYQIRNSYGQSCKDAGYDPSLSCDQWGDVWVPAKYVSDNLRGLGYIKN